MKKLFVVVAAVSASAAVVPAWAAKPAHPAKPSHPAHGKALAKGKAKGKSGTSCKTLNKGYDAKGTLMSATLSPGAKKGHYDGMLTVDVTRANHKAPQGTQPFTLTDARVRFGKGVSSTAPASGDRVTLHGKITGVTRRCSSSSFTPTITVRNIRIRAPKQ